MNYRELAVKKAKEGGYIGGKNTLKTTRKLTAYDLVNPLFWWALGKSLGWKRLFAMSSYGTTGGKESGDWYYDGLREDDNSNPETTTPEWHYRWIKFIDHLAEGKDIESYFQGILKKTS